MADTDGKAQNYQHYVGRPRQIYGSEMAFRHTGIRGLYGTGEQAGSATGVFPYTFPLVFVPGD